MIQQEIISTGVFIDGGYFAKINESLSEARGMVLDISKLLHFVRASIAEREQVPKSCCQATECHYFRGRYRAGAANAKKLLFAERKFEDELIEKLKGAYGLVWDGDSLCSCEGNYGAYLKINNPHKVSLYLAAGLPVIVWKQSALYSFICENGVGFGVDSLETLDEALTQHESEYEGYCQRVQELQSKLKNGAYMHAAIKQAELLCGVCGGQDEQQ